MPVEVIVKDGVEIVRILEAFDLMRSFRGAANVAGCDHHTVRRMVALREAGSLRRRRRARRRPIATRSVGEMQQYGLPLMGTGREPSPPAYVGRGGATLRPVVGYGERSHRHLERHLDATGDP